MNIKRLVSLVLILVICSMSVVGFAQNKEQSQLDVYHINSEENFMEFYLDNRVMSLFTGYDGNSEVYSIVNGSTFMQLKGLGDQLGVLLYWHQNTREVSFDANKKSVLLKINSKVAFIGNEKVILDSAPFIKDGRTFVPLRFVSEALGIEVNYNDLRPEGEFAKKAIFENYPNVKRMVDLGNFKQGSNYVFNRLKVDSYQEHSNRIGIVFEEVTKYSSSKPKRLNWFQVDLDKRTIYDEKQSKITIDWYEKENNQQNNVDNENSAILVQERNIPFKVKDYLSNGQSELSNAEAFWWEDTHLEALSDETINKLYSKFLESGGNGDNIVDFAEYLSMNAPIYPNWKEVFESTFVPAYEQDIVRYEGYGNEIYGVYLDIEGRDTPIVYVNAITGHYRG